MSVFFLADSHLSPTIWTHRVRISGDSYRALASAVDVIVRDHARERVSAVLFGGDVFDSVTPDSYSEFVFSCQCDRLLDLDIKMYGVQGNHDKCPLYPRFSLFGVEWLHDRVERIEGRLFYGLDYEDSRERYLEELGEAPECDFLLTHVPFKHLLGVGAWKVAASEVPERIRNVLVGDVHKRHVARFKDKRGRIVSPGSTIPRSVQEFGRDFGIFKLSFGDSGDAELSHFPVRTREFIRTSLEKAAGELAVLKDKEDSAKPVFEVSAEHGRRSEVESLAVKYAGAAFVIPAVEARRPDVERIGDDAAVTIDEAVDMVCDSAREPEAHALLLEIAKNPKSAGAAVEHYLERKEVRLADK